MVLVNPCRTHFFDFFSFGVRLGSLDPSIFYICVYKPLSSLVLKARAIDTEKSKKSI